MILISNLFILFIHHSINPIELHLTTARLQIPTDRATEPRIPRNANATGRPTKSVSPLHRVEGHPLRKVTVTAILRRRNDRERNLHRTTVTETRELVTDLGHRRDITIVIIIITDAIVPLPEISTDPTRALKIQHSITNYAALKIGSNLITERVSNIYVDGMYIYDMLCIYFFNYSFVNM